MLFELFTLHLRFRTLKRFTTSNVQYPAQKAQKFKPATDLIDYTGIIQSSTIV